MGLIDFLQQMAEIAFWLLVITVCLGLAVCVYLGVRRAQRQELRAERDERL